MDWYKLPEGMRNRRQWICADEDKEPINPVHGGPAKSDDPSTWGSFEEATRAAIWNGYDIAFVLSTDDEFSIIDLDNKEHAPAPEEMLLVHRDILQRSDTYIERSISGTGYHLVVLGKPARPVKTPHIEQYGSVRYMICTGDVVKDLPPADGRELLDLIDQHFGSLSVALAMDELPDFAPGIEVQADEEIIALAANASNGDKFERLWTGDKSDYQDDHSAADAALLNLLCFYTPHNEQVRRLFKESALYRPNQRNKQDKYLNYSISKWRAENIPIDLASLRFPVLQAEAEGGQDDVATLPDPLAVPTIADSDIDLPPGLVGQLALFCYKHSYRQVKEGSIAAAISYVAGLVGRSYHVNGVGLNQYIAFLAGSGVGKEGAKKAIRAMHNHLSVKIPAIKPHLGSGDFSAGVSLVKELGKQPCQLSMIGEIGQTFQILLDPRAPAQIKELKKAVTEAWSESGPNGMLSSRRYSDSAKNAADVFSPCLNLLGESVPDEFYKALNASIAADGFLPRWLIFEFTGDRQSPNRNRQTAIPELLAQQLINLYLASVSILQQGGAYDVQSHPQAGMMLASYEEKIDEDIRSEPKGSPMRAVLNRCYEKAMRLAALFAVCENAYQPIITPALAKAAINLVERCDKHMTDKFRAGEIASQGRQAENQFVAMVEACSRAYIEMTPAKRIQYKCPASISEVAVIPTSYLRDQLKRRVAFMEHPLGAIRAVEMAIKAACEEGVLVKVGMVDKRSYGLNQDIYRVGEGFGL